MNISRALVALAGFVLLCLVIARPVRMHGTSGEAAYDNHPPTAVDDSYSVHGTLVVPGPGILANDTDPDNDILHIGSCGSVAHGTLSCTSSSFTYAANYGYVGSDSFTYQSCDGDGACASGTVTLTITNSAPVAVSDNYTMHGDTFFVPGPNALRQNDSDPEGDSFSVTSNTQTSHGTVTYSSYYGSLRYELTNSWYSGTDSFTYTICDNLGACSTGTATFNVVEGAPTPISDFFVTHDTLTVPGPNALRANDSDPDGDPISVYSVGSPSHGTTSYSGGGFTYQPATGFSGSDSFTYLLCDNLWLCSTGTVYVLVLPAALGPPNSPYGCVCPSDPAAPGGFGPLGGGLAGASGGTSGSGPSAGDPVNLATGRETYTPEPDLTIYNPTGPSVVWQRSYLSTRALSEPSGYSSPGLSRGWVHNYDISIQATSGSWGNLNLIYPNGATETLTPQVSGGNPTGAFTTVAGAPYIVTGVSGSPTGVWQSVTVTWKDQTQWKFTQLSGTTYALSQLINRTGESLDFSWNSSRALTQVSDHGTSTTLLSLVYSNGQLSTATDAYARKVAYTFTTPTSTAASALQSVSQVVTSNTSNPPAHWTFGYTSDKGQQLNTITVPSPTGTGNSTATMNYDSVGKVSSLVDGNGNQRVYTYNSGTTGIQVKDSSNNVALAWTQKFNSGGMNTGITDAATHSTTVAYGDTSNPLKPTSVKDRNNHETTYTYDQFGNVTQIITPRSLTITFTWNYTHFALGRLTSIQEGSKAATTFTYYEPSGLVETITRPEPSGGAGTTTTTLTYDSLGNVLTVVAPGNNSASTITTTLNYTSDGSYSQSAKTHQPITVTDNLSHITHLRYDSQGRVMSATDALGNETDLSYNIVGQRDTTTYPATGQTASGRSHVANAYLFPGGPLTTVTSYDESNTQVRQVTHAYGLEGESLSSSGSTEPVTITYDALYRLRTLTDGNSHTTTYAYNSIGLPSSITMPGSEVTQFTSYDNAGNLLQRIDGNSVTTNYVYDDDESQLTDIAYPASTSLNVHFDYDSYGRRSAMADSTGSQSYTYGNLDELLSVITTYTGLSGKTISYSYYPNGTRESMTTPAGTFNYSFDGAGRPASMTNPFSETTSWSYENNNWLSTQTLSNGAVATYTHNALGQVTELLNQIGSTTISDFSSIAYDGIGNRTSVSASIPGATSLNGTTGYTYDTKNQLTQETSTRNGGFTDNFAYDTAANPTTFKGVTNSYNSNNQQTGTGFTHDGNGNPTTYGGATLAFDPENRLTSFGSALTAGYNGDGLRAWKQNSSTTTYFLYDGILPIVELDSSGNVIATNSFGASGLVSRRTGSTSVFYSFDSEGNVSQRSNASGSVLSNYLFAAHGAILSGTLTEPFGYKGRFGYYTDSETGLQLLTHRYYDPSRGRFLTRDPISYNGGVNLYAYVSNSPINYIDPAGEETLQIGLSGSVIVSVVGVSGSVGIAIDGSGNIGVYFTGGVGAALGEHASGGIGVYGSNAGSINGLAGPFNNASIGAGDGVDATIDGFSGNDPSSGGTVLGGGFTAGGGVGGGASDYVTVTKIIPIWSPGQLFDRVVCPPDINVAPPQPLPPNYPRSNGSYPSSAPPVLPGPVPQPAPTPPK